VYSVVELRTDITTEFTDYTEQERKRLRYEKIGLTGSIAVGKSFVCEVFRELGCAVLDADRVARDVVEPGTVGLDRVVAGIRRNGPASGSKP
jgi:hypothetical protein